MDIPVYTFGNNAPQMVPKDLNIGELLGFGGLIQDKSRTLLNS